MINNYEPVTLEELIDNKKVFSSRNMSGIIELEEDNYEMFVC